MNVYTRDACTYSDPHMCMRGSLKGAPKRRSACTCMRFFYESPCKRYGLAYVLHQSCTNKCVAKGLEKHRYTHPKMPAPSRHMMAFSAHRLATSSALNGASAGASETCMCMQAGFWDVAFVYGYVSRVQDVKPVLSGLAYCKMLSCSLCAGQQR